MADYLKIVAGVFYFWRKIPHDLSEFFEQSHFKVSLHTRHKKGTKEQVLCFSLWCNRIFSMMRSGAFSADEINKVKGTAPFKICRTGSKEKSSIQQQSPATIMAIYGVYELEHVRAKRWREKTRTDQRQMVRIFIELLG